MTTSIYKITPTGVALNSAAAGLEFAATLAQALGLNETVKIDFEGVERMTPSYANALVFSLLEQFGASGFEQRVQRCNASSTIEDGWQKAVDRYRRGIRLSSQRTAG